MPTNFASSFITVDYDDNRFTTSQAQYLPRQPSHIVTTNERTKEAEEIERAMTEVATTMAPIIYMIEVAASTPTSTPFSTINGEIIVNIISGLFAVAFDLFSLRQGRRLWLSSSKHPVNNYQLTVI